MIKELIQKKKQEKAERNFLPNLHHTLMREYGWIPLEEFKKIPISTAMSLYTCIVEEYEENKKKNDKMKLKGRK